MNLKTQAIIFDVGNVVVHISFDQVFQSWANFSNQSFESIKNNFRYDHAFSQYEFGLISPTQFKQMVCQQLDLKISEEDFHHGWNDLYQGIVPGIESLLLHLKNKYRIVALSNTNTVHASEWMIRYPAVFSLFEKLFCSYDLGCQKPDASIYQMVLDELQLPANQCLFLDDMPENTQAAHAIGFDTITVHSFLQMKNALLLKLMIEIPKE